MSYDFSHLTIPTFPGINDTPIEPTETKAGNGSHLISKFNDFLSESYAIINFINDSVSELQNNPPAPPDRWIGINDGYNLQSPSEKLFLYGQFNPATDRTIVFHYEPSFFASVRIFNSSNCNIRISMYGRFQEQDINFVYVDSSPTPKEVGFIWLDSSIGWICTDSSLIRVT